MPNWTEPKSCMVGFMASVAGLVAVPESGTVSLMWSPVTVSVACLLPALLGEKKMVMVQLAFGCKSGPEQPSASWNSPESAPSMVESRTAAVPPVLVTMKAIICGMGAMLLVGGTIGTGWNAPIIGLITADAAD